MGRAEKLMPEPAPSRRWLSIVGIGEDGIEGLSATARGLIGDAEIVFGGARHLALAAPLIRGEARPWPSETKLSLRSAVHFTGRRSRRAAVISSPSCIVRV